MRTRDTAPETAIRSALHAQGFRYRVDMPPVAGIRRRADIVFTKQKIAVFVDGCYWHGCPDHWREPRTNRDYWVSKIRRNSERDRETDKLLTARQWAVLRFWEHEDPRCAVEIIAREVRRRRALHV